MYATKRILKAAYEVGAERHASDKQRLMITVRRMSSLKISNAQQIRSSQSEETTTFNIVPLSPDGQTSTPSRLRMKSADTCQWVVLVLCK